LLKLPLEGEGIKIRRVTGPVASGGEHLVNRQITQSTADANRAFYHLFQRRPFSPHGCGDGAHSREPGA